ncbi:B3/4 domain-containing protein [Streptosporangium lutulentum]
MIENIWVDPSVGALRPDFAVLAMGVYGLRNGTTDDRSRGWLAEAAEKAVAADDPKVEAWRDAYRAFGAKPQRTRPSVDALVRRMPLPEINQVVDAYNAISVRHGLPIGGEDLNHYEGTARLIRATGEEPFEVVEKGERDRPPGDRRGGLAGRQGGHLPPVELAAVRQDPDHRGDHGRPVPAGAARAHVPGGAGGGGKRTGQDAGDDHPGRPCRVQAGRTGVTGIGAA